MVFKQSEIQLPLTQRMITCRFNDQRYDAANTIISAGQFKEVALLRDSIDRVCSSLHLMPDYAIASLLIVSHF